MSRHSRPTNNARYQQKRGKSEARQREDRGCQSYMYQDMTNHGWRYSNKDGWQPQKTQDRNRNWRDHSSPRGGYQRKDEYDGKKSGDQRAKHVHVIDSNYGKEEESEEIFL